MPALYAVTGERTAGQVPAARSSLPAGVRTPRVGGAALLSGWGRGALPAARGRAAPSCHSPDLSAGTRQVLGRNLRNPACCPCV